MSTATKENRASVVYRRNPGDPLTAAQRANIDELLQSKTQDHAIDTSDAPELPASVWKDAVRQRELRGLYRPMKQAVSLRLDADVLAWLKKDGQGYQTRANQILREKMLGELEGR